jgi:DNA polymerase elongation subunit (family B)
MSYISAVKKDDKVIVWERTETGDRIVKDYKAPYYFYYDDEGGEYTTIFDTKVSKVEFTSGFKLSAAKKDFEARKIRTWESDIPAEIRLLSNKYYGKPAPKLNITLFDIEVDYDPEMGITVQDMVAINPYAPINSVSLIHCWKKEIVVIVVPPEPGWDEVRLSEAVIASAPDAPLVTDLTIRYIVCETERELLLNLILEIEDSDVVGGWNSDFFDWPYVAQRVIRVLDEEVVTLETMETINEYNGKLNVVYVENPNPAIQKAGRFRWLKRLDFPQYGMPTFRPVANATTGKLMGNTIDLVGRIRADYMNLIKKYEPGEKPSYKLSAISADILVDDKTKKPLLPKLEYEGSLADQYRQNFPFFVRYNIRDTEILWGFEKKLGYVEVANQNYHLSTGLFTHVLGTLKLAELALVNFCHHELHRVVKNVTAPEIDRAIDGALVLLPQIGMHENFGSIDINSLYPSAIRSLNISPETIRGQFTRDVKDAAEIAANSVARLTMVMEGTKQEVTKTADEWREYFIERKWAISGYGTVFDQTKQGFIPALLGEWYALRKKYQAMKGQAADAGDYQTAGYYDRLQYVYKIKLNSLYGALTNLYFRFYDLRMGESTTGTGRVILRHQCRMVSKTLEGTYDVNFPLYDTMKSAVDAGYTEDEARPIVLDGPVFNGKFQSDAVIYGDTDSTYFKTYSDSSAEAIMIADAVAAKVNESYPTFMRNTFLCTTGYDNIIKAGREIVSDRGIFVEKKRYILHLIDLDGKTVDKMKVMGLDTKKTTLPAEVSKRLNGFIERFLKGEQWDSVSESIVQYKDDLMSSTDIMAIGLPKGVKGIEKYTSLYEREGNDARLPGHVAAAIYYNEQLQQYKDKLSLPISSGMKIKVFYLIGNHGKFKSIALPTDLELIPAWFTDNFRIDRDAHIERLVDNPLSNILKAIGKQPPSRQSLLVDSLLVF